MQIEGFPDDIFTVEDTGGGVRGNIVDIWFPELATAAAFGTKSLRVTLLANADT
jgi:3D (Asp-Asp-Asp) domain-containing protein